MPSRRCSGASGVVWSQWRWLPSMPVTASSTTTDEPLRLGYLALRPSRCSRGSWWFNSDDEKRRRRPSVVQRRWPPPITDRASNPPTAGIKPPIAYFRLASFPNARPAERGSRFEFRRQPASTLGRRRARGTRRPWLGWLSLAGLRLHAGQLPV